MSRAAGIVLDDPTASHEIETLARAVGISARTLSRLFASENAIELQELVPARPHPGRD
jgi:transcriptional regulator GlxA family with amidase domain